jgi:signal transduction histidine kinase
MDKSEEITKNIIRLPIYSLLLFALLLGISLFFIVSEYKAKELNEYKTILLYSKKELAKTEVKSTIAEIDNDYKHLINKEKKYIKDRVYEADNIIKRVIKNNPNLSKEQLKNIIKQTVSAVRFKNGDGYYFVYNYDTNIMLVHAFKKLIGKNMINLQDAKGTYVFKKSKKIIKENREGFFNIYYIKPTNTKKAYKKVVFVKYIPELNWVVGTGFYIDNSLKKFQKEQLNEINNKRYGKNQYFFIMNAKNCIMLVNTNAKGKIGKSWCNLKDLKGNLFAKRFKEVALNGGGFVRYYWKNPETNKIEEKISYVEYYPKFNWIIGTGVYLSDINKIIDKQKEEIEKENAMLYFIFFGVLFLVLSIVLFFAYRLSKKTKKAFNIYKDDLENRIDKAVKESIKKDKMLQEQAKLAQMGEMIGMIAHQWRQPLNAIALYIQSLPEMFECCEENEECEEFIKKNMKTIQFMSNTIDDFRNFFKSDKEEEKFSIKKELDKVCSLSSAQLKTHNIDLEILGEDFEVIGYKNQFAQVILNLITNSKDAILEHKIKEGKITILMDKNNKKLYIKDNGGGIKTDNINKIFEPYFSTKGVQGTGIGLYMSKMILRNMQADIYAKNSENGAEFVIEFSPKISGGG